MPDFGDMIELLDDCQDAADLLIPTFEKAIQLPTHPIKKCKIFNREVFKERVNAQHNRFHFVNDWMGLPEVSEYERYKLNVIRGTRYPEMQPAGTVLAVAIFAAYEDMNRFLQANGLDPQTFEVQGKEKEEERTKREQEYKTKVVAAIKLELSRRPGYGPEKINNDSKSAADAGWEFLEWVTALQDPAIAQNAKRTVQAMVANAHLDLAAATLPDINQLNVAWLRSRNVHRKNFQAVVTPGVDPVAQLQAQVDQLKAELAISKQIGQDAQQKLQARDNENKQLAEDLRRTAANFQADHAALAAAGDFRLMFMPGQAEFVKKEVDRRSRAAEQLAQKSKERMVAVEKEKVALQKELKLQKDAAAQAAKTAQAEKLKLEADLKASKQQVARLEGQLAAAKAVPIAPRPAAAANAPARPPVAAAPRPAAPPAGVPPVVAAPAAAPAPGAPPIAVPEPEAAVPPVAGAGVAALPADGVAAAGGGGAPAPVDPHPEPAAQAAVAAKIIDRRKARKF